MAGISISKELSGAKLQSLDGTPAKQKSRIPLKNSRSNWA
jgi:hypothetical protein